MKKTLLVASITLFSFFSIATELICEFENADGSYKEIRDFSTAKSQDFSDGKLVILDGATASTELAREKYGDIKGISNYNSMAVLVVSEDLNDEPYWPHTVVFLESMAPSPFQIADSYLEFEYDGGHVLADATGSNTKYKFYFSLDLETNNFELTTTTKWRSYYIFEDYFFNKNTLSLTGTCNSIKKGSQHKD